jgi:hypothetical protein
MSIETTKPTVKRPKTIQSALKPTCVAVAKLKSISGYLVSTAMRPRGQTYVGKPRHGVRVTVVTVVASPAGGADRDGTGGLELRDEVHAGGVS